MYARARLCEAPAPTVRPPHVPPSPAATANLPPFPAAGVVSRLRRNAYNMVLHKFGQHLYRGLEDTLRDHLSNVVRRCCRRVPSYPAALPRDGVTPLSPTCRRADAATRRVDRLS